MEFTSFVLSHLPPAPARVLEVGCGREGGVTPALADAGYDVLGIDPRAPEGPLFRPLALEDLEEPAAFDAVVASRVLHHVSPLRPAVEKLARLAPLLLLDEFAHERLDDAARGWYEGQFRILVASGQEPPGPPSLGRWREEHRGLHASGTVLDTLATRFETRLLEWRPYLYRWLGGVATETLEEGLIAGGGIPALGFRYAGVATSGTARSEAAAR